MRRALALALLAACGTEQTGPGGPGGPGPADTPGDLGILERMLAGELDRDEGFRQVAWSGGWPIEDGGAFVFAVADEGLGPYVLHAPDGGFPDVTLSSEGGVAWARVPIAAPDGQAYAFRTNWRSLRRDRP